MNLPRVSNSLDPFAVSFTPALCTPSRPSYAIHPRHAIQTEVTRSLLFRM
jgi:hypothetical protein